MKSVLLIMLCALVCDTGCSSMARSYPYRVVAVNLSQNGITEHRVLDGSGTYNFGGGNLVPSGYKANVGPMETSPSDVFTVQWKDDQKIHREQRFDLREKVKPSFRGEIVFVLGLSGDFTVEIVAAPEQYPIPPRP